MRSQSHERLNPKPGLAGEREAHESKNFDDIEYCKNCDFLYDDPEAIVWTNDKDHKLYNMLGTGEDFILTKYDSKEKVIN